MSILNSGYLFVYCAVFLLSLNGLFAKLIPLDAVSITQFRSIIALLGLMFVCLLRQRRLGAGSWTRILGIYLLGILLGVHWTTFFHSMQVSSVAVGMLSLFSFPMLTILLEPLFNHRRLARRDIVSGILVFLGLVIMIGPDLGAFKGAVPLGVFWGLFSALLFSLRNLLQKYLYDDIPSDILMVHQVAAIALMLIPFASFKQVPSLPPVAMVNLFLLGVLSTAGAHTFYAAALKRLMAKSAALIGCLQPVLASLLAWLVLHETPRSSVLVGGALILGVAVYESAIRNSESLRR